MAEFGEPPPFDGPDLAPRVAQEQAVLGFSNDVDDVAIVADGGAAAVDRRKGAAVEAQLVASGDGQIEKLRLVASVVDGFVDRFVAADRASLFEAHADGLADIARLRIGERRDRDAESLVDHSQIVGSLDVEVGDLADDLIVIAVEEARGSVLAFHVERFWSASLAEEQRDFAIAWIGLPHGRENFRQGGFRQDAAQQFDRVARLDRLTLFPVAQHLDGHAGGGLQLQEFQHGARADLADFVDYEHRLAVGTKVSPLDRLQERLQGGGLGDVGVLEGVGLPPGGGDADDFCVHSLSRRRRAGATAWSCRSRRRQ